MIRPSPIFSRRGTTRQKAYLAAASDSPRPYWRRWEVVVNAALALAQVVAIGFLFVAFKAQEQALHSQQQALTDQVFARLDDRDAEIIKVFIERPHLRPFFYEGVSPPTGMDTPSADLRQQIAAVADLHLMFIEMFDNDYVRRLPDMEYGGKYDLLWNSYFLQLFRRSPALCARYAETQDQYSPSMCNRYAKATCKCKAPPQR